MSRSRLAAVVLACAIVATVLPLAAAGARSRHAPKRTPPLPAGFVGMNLSKPMFPTERGIDLVHQFAVMAASGVESIRVPFDWATAQPYATWEEVPPSQRSQFTSDANGTPTRFGPLDAIVGLAAAHGITVLPTVINAPDWDGVSGPGAAINIPNSPYYYANFIVDLVHRYGPNGSFWTTGHPKVPIEMWQIWNEPNLISYWWKQPFEQSYVTMLEAIYPVIKAADPHAKVVLAGFPNYSWGYLERIYRIHGARRFFDIVSIHPYTRQPQGVVTIAKLVRLAMDTHGDPHKPMMITETGWTSSLGHTRHLYDIETTEAVQAKDLGKLLQLLAAQRQRLKLLAVYWYDWANVERPGGGPFAYSGLFKINSGRFVAKPAFSVFRHNALALEHCRIKGVRATVCRGPG